MVPRLHHPCNIAVHLPSTPVLLDRPRKALHPPLCAQEGHRSIRSPGDDDLLPLGALREELRVQERNVLLRTGRAFVVAPVVRVGWPAAGVVCVGMNGLQYVLAVEVLRGPPREAWVVLDLHAVLLLHTEQPGGELLHHILRPVAGRGQHVVRVKRGRDVLHCRRGGILALLRGVGEVLAAVAEEVVPAARLPRRIVRRRGDEGVAVHEGDKGELVDVVVPVGVDPGVADQKSLHVDRVRVVDQLLGQRRAVVPPVALRSDVEVVGLEGREDVEPRLEEEEVVVRRLGIGDVLILLRVLRERE
eukprot:Sspe_Gene.67848::Locus_40013_Transcript_1_1_Confidence_1.000_Length_1049::g.67848::m.67848